MVRKKAGTTKRTRPRKAPPPALLAPSRERILNAAFSSFTEKGYARTSTLEIATRAKVSKRELYALCSDKSALLRDAVTERAKRMRLALELPACLAVWRRDLLLALGGWRDVADADHDLALRFAAAAPAILHLPYPAYIGPKRPRQPLLKPAPTPRAWPKVSVIIPSRDAPDLIGRVLDGLFAGTDYPDFDVTIIDNGSTDARTLARYAAADPRRLRVDIRPAPFNFSRAVNRGAALSDGGLLLLLNNDVDVVEPGWLKEMVACLDYPQAAIVGAKLLYPDGTLQHAGVIAGLGGYAGHWHIGLPADTPGPQGRLGARQSLSVVTGACLLVTRACFARLGGFDEETFPIAYNDVDFCLRAGALGFRVVWTPFATLIHHESASRGSDETPENRARFLADKAALQARHRTDALEDRAYNPWAARGSSDPWPSARGAPPAAR